MQKKTKILITAIISIILSCAYLFLPAPLEGFYEHRDLGCMCGPGIFEVRGNKVYDYNKPHKTGNLGGFLVKENNQFYMGNSEVSATYAYLKINNFLDGETIRARRIYLTEEEKKSIRSYSSKLRPNIVLLWTATVLFLEKKEESLSPEDLIKKTVSEFNSNQLAMKQKLGHKVLLNEKLLESSNRYLGEITIHSYKGETILVFSNKDNSERVCLINLSKPLIMNTDFFKTRKKEEIEQLLKESTKTKVYYVEDQEQNENTEQKDQPNSFH